MAKKKPKGEISRDVIDRLRAAYKHRTNVTGFDTGYVWKDGTKSEEISLRIHVDRKIPVSELDTTEVFPEEFEGFALDIIEGPYRTSESVGSLEVTKRAEILIGGLSCGREDAGTGTLGCLVIDQLTGEPALLSNWHVLMGPNGRKGDPIIQPGRGDGGLNWFDRIATVERSILSAAGDASIARLTGSRRWMPVLAGGNLELDETTEVAIGEVLRKHGRSTNTTEGVVDGIGSYRVAYNVTPTREENRWIDGFKLVPKDRSNPGDLEISMAGDSGSCWYNPRKKSAVGLHFAGEGDPFPGNEFALACHMTRVEEALNFRIARLSDLIEIENKGGTGPQPELTPDPSQPDWPWPWWPWGPFPNPMGPLPRPPIGPFPWPVDPYGPRPLPPWSHGFDAMALGLGAHPAAGFDIDRAASGMAGLETVRVPRTLSGQIRQELCNAIRAYLGQPTLELSERTKLADLATFGGDYGYVIVSDAISDWPYFTSVLDDDDMLATRFRLEVDFGGVIRILRRSIRRRTRS